MKKTIISTGVLLIAFATLSLQSCNSEKKVESTDSAKVDSTVVDTTKALKDTAVVDTGMKGTKVPTPKN
jgi:hypothetical protein